MPTGVPSNQLTKNEMRAVYQAILAILPNEAVPNDVITPDLVRAFRKLSAQVNKVSPKRTYKKKGTVKKKEDTK